MNAAIEPSEPQTDWNGNYELSTAAELYWFANYVNSGNTSANAKLTSDITMNDGVLDSNGDLNSGSFDAWSPIGGHGVDYSGEFDGNGHTISGLYFKNTETNNVGLFGKTASEAYIHDLGVKDSYFFGNSWVGGICGDFASGRIENCWNGATVIANGNDAGGICGSCWQYATIANCYNIGDVSLIQGKDAEPKVKFGGICGTVSYNASASYSIDNCYTLMHRSMPKDDATDPYEGLPYLGLNSDKIYGVLDGDAKVHDSYVKNAEAFVGGEVCYRLNRGVTNGSQKWYQTLGDDPSPVMDNSHNTVYYGYDGDVLKYSNTQLTIPTTKHEQCDATCNARGYSQDCWEDTNSGRIYTEAACLNELNAAAVISYIPSAEDPTYKTNQGDVTGWTQEVNKTYDGVNFAYVAEKVFEDYDGTNDNYGTDEWVSFLVKEANAKNARLKWAWTGGENSKKNSNGKYGGCTLTYKVNSGEETEITLPNTSFEVSPDVYTLNLDGLKNDDVVEFHIKGYGTHTSPNEVTWAVTLEYVSGHNPQHTSAKAATCTEKGNYEYWYCSKCDKHFANAECTTVMTEWEIPALGHNATHNAQKDATCTEDGNIEHWHCSNCNLNYMDETCTNQITGSVVLPATHHANKELVPYKAPTADAEGNIAYWHCPDCNRNFEDNGCTKEIAGTDYILAKLLNVLHIDFNGTSTPIENEHYLDATEIGFTEEGDIIFTTNKQADNKPTVTYPASMINEIGFFNGAPTVEFKANEDPKNEGDYYTTFYSSLEAYTIPEGVKAYTATLDKKNEILNLKETSVIPAGAAVILKSDEESFSLTADEYVDVDGLGDLKGTDVEIPAPENCYILSGTSKLGMGLYPWAGEGKKLSANKAYLQLTEASSAKAFMFNFVEYTDGVESLSPTLSEGEGVYNLQGIRVNDSYKGIVIKNGKKIHQK